MTVVLVGGHLALLDEIVDQRGREDRHVERRALFYLRLEIRGGAEFDRQRMARRALELGLEFLHRGLHAVRAQDADGGRRRRGRRGLRLATDSGEERDKEQRMFHGHIQ